MLSLEQMRIAAYYIADQGVICPGCLATEVAEGNVTHRDGDAFLADYYGEHLVEGLCQYTVDTMVGDGDCDVLVCEGCHGILAESHTDGDDWRETPFDGCYCSE